MIGFVYLGETWKWQFAGIRSALIHLSKRTVTIIPDFLEVPNLNKDFHVSIEKRMYSQTSNWRINILMLCCEKTVNSRHFYNTEKIRTKSPVTTEIRATASQVVVDEIFRECSSRVWSRGCATLNGPSTSLEQVMTKWKQLGRNFPNNVFFRPNAS